MQQTLNRIIITASVAVASLLSLAASPTPTPTPSPTRTPKPDQNHTPVTPGSSTSARVRSTHPTGEAANATSEYAVPASTEDAPVEDDKRDGTSTVTRPLTTLPATAGGMGSVGGTPIAVLPPAGKTKSVGPENVKFDDAHGTVEVHVNDANVLEVLRMLSAQSQKNIIASKEVNGTVTANLYGVTVREALDAILTSSGYTYREKGNFIFVYTAKELQQMDKAARVLKTEVARLYYTPAANAVNMIKPVLSADAQVSFTTAAQSGINSGTGDVGGNSHAVEDMIVVTDYVENLDAMRAVLKEVDRRPQQILIEATILRAGLTEDNALGVDFNLLAGVNFANLTSNGTGQVTGAGIDTARASGNAGSIGSGNSFSSSVPGGLKLGFVSDNVSVFLSALEGVTDTVILANPKILALNKQKGEVIVGRKDGFLTTTTTETTTVQSVEFLDTGTRLIFRPFIGDDGYVRMEIHPEDSSGGLTSANLPFKITTEVTSNIMVKDGNTIVIGGLFREASDTGRSQVPVLGNLPLAGALFRQQRDRTTREEIIILLTPHVIKDDAAFAEASEGLLRDADKLRVGVRRGMMPWGRERMSEMNYQWAQDELKKPNPDRSRVLWHLDCATNLNPKFMEAIKLKERMTGQILSASDNSSTRNFFRNRMLADRRAELEKDDRSLRIERQSAGVTAGGDLVATSPTIHAPTGTTDSPPVTPSAESTIKGEQSRNRPTTPDGLIRPNTPNPTAISSTPEREPGAPSAAKLDLVRPIDLGLRSTSPAASDQTSTSSSNPPLTSPRVVRTREEPGETSNSEADTEDHPTPEANAVVGQSPSGDPPQRGVEADDAIATTPGDTSTVTVLEDAPAP